MSARVKVALGRVAIVTDAEVINNLITATIDNEELNALYRAVALYDSPMLISIDGDNYTRAEWVSTVADVDGGTIIIRRV